MRFSSAFTNYTQLTFTCSNSTEETLEEGVNFVQTQQYKLQKGITNVKKMVFDIGCLFAKMLIQCAITLDTIDM